jgi:hypothetical protein
VPGLATPRDLPELEIVMKTSTDPNLTGPFPRIVPSGGDWALRPAGAITLWNTTRATIVNCSFLRTDSNAVFLGGRARNTTVAGCEFAWIGM